MEKIALLFPGQGAQFSGMGKELYDEHKTARDVFDEACDILDRDLKEICFKGSLLSLNRIENMLPAIFTVSVAAFRVLRQELAVHPAVSAGHSLGEYSALVCSGAVEFSDALRIVKKRCELAQRIVDEDICAMTIVDGIDRFLLEEECRKASFEQQGESVGISCYNSFEQFVVAGSIKAVMDLEKRLISMNVQTTPMLTSAPFHSPYMDSVTEEFTSELQKYSYKTPQWPVLSNVTAREYKDGESVALNLVNQLTKPVLWSQSMDYISSMNVNIAIEPGPQSILKNLTLLNAKHIRAFSFDKKEDRKSLHHLTGINGKASDYNFAEKGLGLSSGICNNNHDEKTFEKEVLISYKKLEQMTDVLEREDRKAGDFEMRDIAALVNRILKAKNLSLQDRKKSIKALFSESGEECLFEKISPSLQ